MTHPTNFDETNQADKSRHLRELARLALSEKCPKRKVELTFGLGDLNWAGSTEPHLFPQIDGESRLEAAMGRPDAPLLTQPRNVPHGPVSTPKGRGMLLHALAHIEFNAINLALDLIVRFHGMPAEFYLDWLKVAQEEAYHHSLLCERMGAYGIKYGDYSAHDGLWQMAEKTKDSLLARLALVPRLLEARGLDVSPSIRQKLDAAGDSASAAVLDIILRDEIGHVAIGNRWFNELCQQSGVDPISAFENCLEQYLSPKPRSPFNFEARRQAGFSEAELAWLYHLELEQVKSH
ncbi:MAG: ferritin-like domain-containing protein [Limnobacter sp.]|nr:ferritin-like domain-containing protein [Limnobacter sp.]